MSFERPNIRKMKGYTSGEQPDDPATIKLNTNENPYPASKSVDEVIRGFTANDLRRYPPADADGFRDLAAQLHGVSKDNIIATRGGDELLRLVITTFVDPGERIGVTNPTYSLYPVLAEIQDCPLHEVDLNPDWSTPDGFAQEMNAAGVKLTLIVNPHAPSGRLMSVSDVDTLAGELDTLLLLDEAYVDFIDEPYDSISLIGEHDNIIILRTLSKGYSLAGLRFGYGIGQKSLIQPMMTKTRDSYNLDVFGQKIAEAAIADQDSARMSWKLVIRERARLQAELEKLGLPSPSSQTNFLLVEAPNRAQAIYEALKSRNILIRYFSSPKMADKLRISVGSAEENDKLIKNLAEILEYL